MLNNIDAKFFLSISYTVHAIYSKNCILNPSVNEQIFEATLNVKNVSSPEAKYKKKGLCIQKSSKI